MSRANHALIDQFRNDFYDYARGGLEDFLRAVEGEAKRLAPVRKVFKGGGRRQLAWRSVYSTAAKSDITAIRQYGKTFGTQRTAMENVQGMRVITQGGRRTVQIRTYQQQEPYSSPVRSSWTKVDLGKYKPRKGSLLDAKGRRAVEPYLFSGGRGGQAYVFGAFDQLNYEGRRSLMRGVNAVQSAGYEYVDLHRGGMITIAGPDRKVESGAGGRGHREDIAQINTKRESFNKEFTLQLGGALRKSIEMEPPEITGPRIRGSVGTDLRYALYVEFGTARHGAAQPYLRPALMRYRYLLAKSVGSNIRNRNK